MNRLIAFGCSYTFGQGLPDADYENRIPSRLAWPSMLAQHLGSEVTNMAEPGSGNLEILWRVLRFDFDPSDTCFIMWSHFTRASIFQDTGIKRLDFGRIGRFEKAWLRVHPEHDQLINNWLYIHHATMYLNSLGIRPYHILSGGTGDEPTGVLDIPRVLKSEFVLVDRGSDGLHPGKHSHSQLAGRIANEISGLK